MSLIMREANNQFGDIIINDQILFGDWELEQNDGDKAFEINNNGTNAISITNGTKVLTVASGKMNFITPLGVNIDATSDFSVLANVSLIFRVDGTNVYIPNAIIRVGNTSSSPAIDSQGTNIRLSSNNTTGLGALEIDSDGNVNLTENIDIATGKDYQINTVSILNATTLGSSVINSSLTSLGPQAEDLDMNSNDINNVSTFNATSLGGTLTTGAQPNITSVGTLTSLSITGDLTVDTNTFFVNASSNRIGLGTITPDTQLHLSSANPRIKIQNTSTGGLNQLSFFNDVDFLDFDIGTFNNECFISQRNNDMMQFLTNNGTPRMTILGGGNIGIGQTNPATILDVNGTITTDNVINTGTLIMSSSDGDKISLFNGGAILAHSSGFSMDYKSGSGSGTNGKHRFMNTLSNSYVERMVIDINGFVGINEDTPTTFLHVLTASTTSNLTIAEFRNETANVSADSLININCVASGGDPKIFMGIDGHGRFAMGQDANDLRFHIAWSDVDSGAQGFTMNPSGQVGIGDANNPSIDLAIVDNDTGFNASSTDINMLSNGVSHYRIQSAGKHTFYTSGTVPGTTTGIDVIKGVNDGTDNRFINFSYNSTVITTIGATNTGGIRIDGGGTLVIDATSSIVLKKNVRENKDECYQLMKDIRGVKFDWKDKDMPNDCLGFIAEEVEQYYPRATGTLKQKKYKKSKRKVKKKVKSGKFDKETTYPVMEEIEVDEEYYEEIKGEDVKSLSQMSLIPILWSAVRKLMDKVEEQETTITSILARLDVLEA